MPTELMNEVKELVPPDPNGYVFPGDPSKEGVMSDVGGRTSTLGNFNAKVRVYKSAAQSIAETATKVQFDAESYDPGENYDVTLYRFTAKQDGYYHVSSSVGMENLTAALGVQIYIYVNGISVNTTINYNGSGAGADTSAFLTDIRRLYLNDYVEIYANKTAAGAAAVLNDTAKTWLAIHLLSI